MYSFDFSHSELNNIIYRTYIPVYTTLVAVDVKSPDTYLPKRKLLTEGYVIIHVCLCVRSLVGECDNSKPYKLI